MSESTALSNLSRAKTLLAETKNLTEILKIRDMAMAAKHWAETARGGEENARLATEIKLRAERRAGEILKETPRAEFKPGKISRNTTLRDLNIGRMESSRWQRIAKIPEERFEAYIARAQHLRQSDFIHAQARFNVSARETPKLPDGIFNVIYADPPWPTKIGGMAADPEDIYETMTMEDIAQTAIPSAENAILFLWSVNILLKEAIWVMEQWGFKYRTNMAWVKDRFGAGFYFRGQHELLLLGKKGDMHAPREEDRPSSVLQAARRGHSEKPSEAYSMIEKMYPGCSYLELFARKQHKGWTSWGKEVLVNG